MGLLRKLWSDPSESRRPEPGEPRSADALLVYPGWEPLIPPRELWAGPNDPFAHFIRWSWEYLAYLTLLCELRRDGFVLELGCNHGRTMLGLASYLGPSARYEGLDILPRQIDFAREAAKALPFPANFQVADVFNGSYNPGGTQSASTYRFPYADASFDVAYAASLFTHLVPDDAQNYLRETARVLRPGGRALFSFFVLDSYRGVGTTQAPLYEFDHPFSEDGDVAVKDPAYPEAVIGYRKRWIERAAKAEGLSLVRIVPGLWSRPADFGVHEQDLVLLEKPKGEAAGRATDSRTDVPARVTTLGPEPPRLSPLSGPIVVGRQVVLSGSGFTPGSVTKLWVSRGKGVDPHGPFVAAAVSPTSLTVEFPGTIALGSGFGSIQVVNTDRSYTVSNTAFVRLEGDPALNIPTIREVDDVALVGGEASTPFAQAAAPVTPGSTLTLGGTGFDDVRVELSTADGSVIQLAPLGGATSGRIQVVVPPETPVGVCTIQVVNAPYTGNVHSNAVVLPVGEPARVTGVSVSGRTVIVTGTGFCGSTIVNVHGSEGDSSINLGGLHPDGTARIPLKVAGPTRLTFEWPEEAPSGPAFVEALNPPFTPDPSAGDDSGGQFTMP